MRWTVKIGRTGRRGGTAALVVAALAVSVGAAPAAVATAGPAALRAGAGPVGTAPAGAVTVTLVTGDRVRVLPAPGGVPALQVEPGPGRDRIGFVREAHTGPGGTDLTVIPSDAVPLLAAGRLDARLFNVTGLVRQGFTDRSGGLPLIVTYPSAPTGPAPAGVQPAVRPLPSVNGLSVRQDRGRAGALWQWLTGGAGRSAPKVWLDGLSQPTLDVSVPQIGAPVAWQAGLTGSGVTVGMLDTGVRADHPDLAGRVVEARDFTGTRPDASDDVGHGTHVAGIIAGSGAASNGRYRGVAPDVKLVSGKVCTPVGCPDSAVIAGLEWIAPKVPVANLSLGGASTDGTDPLSQAVNNLTAKYGTLFVVADGNDRSLDEPDPLTTVTTPASADAALAVGSVTAQDTTSPFSVRGPRRGDRAVKPDLAAPGSGIVSARAPGTPAGDADPVDDNYTRMSGTSMAAPHVTGAAAILRQQHPDWTADRLRSVLMSTAKPTAGVYEQGAGRVDVARAVTQQVTATTGSVSFGFFSWPPAAPVGRVVGYRNDGNAPVTLSVTVAATGPTGEPAPVGLFTTSTNQLTVPPHGNAELTLTATAAAGGSGLYGGRLTASADGIAVQTAFGATVEPESHQLTVRLVSRTGQPRGGLGQVVDTATGAATGLRFDPTGTAVVRLGRGSYDITAIDQSAGPAPADPLQVTLVSRTDLALTADTTVTLDARAGRPVRAVLDRPDATTQTADFGVADGDPTGARTTALSWTAAPGQQLYAVPTTGTVTGRPYAFWFRDTLAPGDLYSDPTGPVYQLAFFHQGGIPADTTYQAPDRSLARVDSVYRTQGGPSPALRADIARLPIPGASGAIFRATLPLHRTEFYTADPSITWQHLLGVTAADESDIEVNYSTRSYRPGRYLANWNTAPLGPAFGDPVDGWGVQRAGNQLAVAVTLLSGNDPAQYTAPPAGMVGTTTLTRGGTLLGTSPTPGFGVFDLPDTPGRYTLRAVATRAVPWSVLGTAVDVSWTFRDPGAGGPVQPLPLYVVRAAGQVDDQDRAPAGVPYPLALTVQQQPGAPAVRLSALRVEVSFDDGAHWRPVPVLRSGTGGVAVLQHPAAAAFVSLRITAADRDGNSVTQTVLRAYQTVAR